MRTMFDILAIGSSFTCRSTLAHLTYAVICWKNSRTISTNTFSITFINMTARMKKICAKNEKQN